VRFAFALASVLLVTAGCYQQPLIPRDRPLACTSDDESECPTGYRCVDNRVCAPRQCIEQVDCPVGLACVRSVCVPIGALLDGGLLPSPDAGAAAADGGAPDGSDAADAAGGS
jgi:hypothetical protein